MKKRNWLMTIAFAVLSLTIISTCVIGSTYAKFTSQVAGGGKAQAAGFLVAGASTEATVATEMVAPTTTVSAEAKINYFSQVDTKIEVTNLSEASTGVTGTGIFAVWDAIVTAYNAQAAEGDRVTAANVTLNKVFTVTLEGQTEGQTLAQAFAAKVAAASSGAVTVKTNEADNVVLSAMDKEATDAVQVTFNVQVKWNSISDKFDTFVGNMIAKNLKEAVEGATQGKSIIEVSLPITASQVVAGA